MTRFENYLIMYQKILWSPHKKLSNLNELMRVKLLPQKENNTDDSKQSKKIMF